MSKKSTFKKDQFKGTWNKAALKEKYVAEQIHEWTGHEYIMDGYGAGVTEYIPGSSAEHGYETAAPDLQIVGTDICVEVTGPLNRLRNTDELLVNITKVDFALNHPEREYWIAWTNGLPRSRSDVRMIRVGEMFVAAIDKAEIVRTQFESRGFMNYFHCVPNDHPPVISFDRFLKYLKTI